VRIGVLEALEADDLDQVTHAFVGGGILAALDV
jgi:hypothetical protein